jgi:hypothetical protein
VEGVRSSIESRAASWLVATSEDRVLACAANVPHQWNQTYEPGRLVVHPEFRRLRLGQELYGRAMQDAYRRDDCDMAIGFPRTDGAYRLVASDTGAPAIVTGHDGGMNVAGGMREYHLVFVTRNPHRALSRVIPSGSAIAVSPFVEREISAHLSLATEVGSFPDRSIVGPPSVQQADVGDGVLSYIYDAGSPCGSLQITDLSPATAAPDRVAGAVERFLAGFPSVAHVSAYVLIHQEQLIRRMRRMGFRATAYLPAWHVSGGKRYDCVMLVRRSFEEEPAAHGIGDVIARFNENLSGFFA